MDIADQFKKVTIAIYKHGFVAPLKQVAGSLLPPVDPAGISPAWSARWIWLVMRQKA